VSVLASKSTSDHRSPATSPRRSYQAERDAINLAFAHLRARVIDNPESA
jgi:hypothetical protein